MLGPFRAQRLLALWGLQVAPAVVAGAIVFSHTRRLGDALIVAAAIMIVARVFEPGRRLSHLMPIASFAVRTAIPIGGIALALAVMLPLRPVAFDDVFAALLGSLATLAVAAVVLARFERSVVTRIAVAGSARLADSLARELEECNVPGFRVVGWIDTGSPTLVPDVNRLGGFVEVGEIVRREHIDLIVNAAGEENRAKGGVYRGASALEVTETVATACLGNDVRLIGINQLHEELFGHVSLGTLDSAFVQFVMHPRFRGHETFGRRLVDYGLGLVAAIVLAPLLALAAISIKLSQGGPVLVREPRIGEGGREFEILRLRSRGGIIHRTHLDEVPQLWNVLRGEMSLVGPRPEKPARMDQIEQELPFYDRRELVRPGITGWAQVRCGEAGSDESTAWKLSHDLYYLKNRSLSLDAMIVLQTAISAVRRVQFSVGAPDEAFGLDAVKSS